jgi:hypothetical protein
MGSRHAEGIGGNRLRDPTLARHVHKADAFYPIPPLLCREIARWATQEVAESSREYQLGTHGAQCENKRARAPRDHREGQGATQAPSW